MTQTTRVWLHGLGAAFVGAAANSLGTMFVDPAKFNLSTGGGLRSLGALALISGASASFFYLKSSPLPPLSTKTETVTQIAASADGTLTTTESRTTTKQGW